MLIEEMCGEHFPTHISIVKPLRRLSIPLLEAVPFVQSLGKQRLVRVSETRHGINGRSRERVINGNTHPPASLEEKKRESWVGKMINKKEVVSAVGRYEIKGEGERREK